VAELPPLPAPPLAAGGSSDEQPATARESAPPMESAKAIRPRFETKRAVGSIVKGTLG
jgi:hypothetical protein